MALLIDNQHEQRIALETRASQHLQDSAHSWIYFCEIALEILDSGLYKDVCSTWEEYVFKTWNIKNASEIRQYKMALPFAKKLIEVLPSVTARNVDMQKLKLVVKTADNPLMPATYILGGQVAQTLERPVSEAIYKHCLATLEENEITNGYPTYGGGHISSQVNGALELIVLDRMKEAKQRHIARLTPRQAISVTFGELTWIDGVLRLIVNESISLQDAELLASGTHKVYIERDDEDG